MGGKWRFCRWSILVGYWLGHPESSLWSLTSVRTIIICNHRNLNVIGPWENARRPRVTAVTRILNSRGFCWPIPLVVNVCFLYHHRCALSMIWVNLVYVFYLEPSLTTFWPNGRQAFVLRAHTVEVLYIYWVYYISITRCLRTPFWWLNF